MYKTEPRSQAHLLHQGQGLSSLTIGIAASSQLFIEVLMIRSGIRFSRTTYLIARLAREEASTRQRLLQLLGTESMCIVTLVLLYKDVILPEQIFLLWIISFSSSSFCERLANSRKLRRSEASYPNF